ncbi:MAG: CDP-diacylglycerol--glycerol-3-phosphate 3-phosphatidyltransferase [Bdellovibrionales bacterium]|nr:CDP-diacylglycerol--glycerol-3-phosphate 3-phosphatidyltransferase [Bdellovibrionales bacterium]
MNSSAEWKKQLPMAATYTRIGLTPFIVATFYFKATWMGWVAAALFIVASITDWLDGYWARKFGAESVMGKFMDPIADKLLVLGALIMLLDVGRVDPLMVLIFLSRDIYIGGLRSVAAANNVIIAAKPFGKVKTALQMVAIPLLLINTSPFGLPALEIGYWALWVSVFLSLGSAVQYSLGYFKGRSAT